jgi:hypothetical protein
MIKSDRKFKRKIGAIVVLGIFTVLMLAQPVAADNWDTNGNGYVGNGGEERIYFDNDNGEIEILEAPVGIGDTSPDFKLEVTGSSGSGYFGVTSSSDGDILVIDSNGNVGIGTANPNGILDIEKQGTGKSNLDILHLTNGGYAADMVGTETSILFNQYYYHESEPAVADAGRITVGTETDWISTASTQDGYLAFHTALDGSVSERVRITSYGNVVFKAGTTISCVTPTSRSDGYNIFIRAGHGYDDGMGVGSVDGGNLYLQGGDGHGGCGNGDGGDVYIYGGAKSDGADGDVLLAQTSQGARGEVAIGAPGANVKLEVLDSSNPQLRLSYTQSTPFVYTDFQTTSDGYLYINPSGGNVGIGTTSPEEMFEIYWASGVDAQIGRGDTDSDITYIRLRSPDGNDWYLYPDNNGDLQIDANEP